MALFKSNLLSQASGSINGVVFSRNRGGQYIRNRSSVTNPGTDRQDVVRTAMTAISKAWGQVLTQAQRDAWAEYGQLTTVTNRLGDPRHLSGIAMFNRVNLFRMSTLGEPMTHDVPNYIDGTGQIPAFVSVALGEGTTSPQLNITLDGLSEDLSFAVYYSGIISGGINYFRGPYAGLLTGPGGDSNTVNIQMPYDYAEGASTRKRAHKITLYDDSSLLPLWTIHTAPLLVPADPGP